MSQYQPYQPSLSDWMDFCQQCYDQGWWDGSDCQVFLSLSWGYSSRDWTWWNNSFRRSQCGDPFPRPWQDQQTDPCYFYPV